MVCCGAVHPKASRTSIVYEPLARPVKMCDVAETGVGAIQGPALPVILNSKPPLPGKEPAFISTRISPSLPPE